MSYDDVKPIFQFFDKKNEKINTLDDVLKALNTDCDHYEQLLESLLKKYNPDKFEGAKLKGFANNVTYMINGLGKKLKTHCNNKKKEKAESNALIKVSSKPLSTASLKPDKEEEGVIFYDENDKRNKYEGEILRGVPHGKGRLEYKDGKVEEGHFDNGVFKKDSEKPKSDKKDENAKSEEPKSSNLLRNIALGTAGLGVAGVAYYMMKKKRKSISSSGSSNRRRSARRSKRNRKSSSRFR